MSGLRIIGTILFFLFCSAASMAVPRQARYGPVVAAYLTGLAEELNELEFQIRHNEISREDYERAKHRLGMLRRYVERTAGRGREDVVPELLVLAQDELKNLGVSRDLSPELLAVGERIDADWRLVWVETASMAMPPKSSMRFFIFMRVAEAEQTRKRDRQRDLEAIETIVLEGPAPKAEPPVPVAASPLAVAAVSVAPAPAAAVPPPQLPRILHIYLPQYTDKAREKQIEGELVVQAMFQRNGKIRDIKVEKGLGHGLDQRAEDSARRIGFLPASVEGKPVDARAEIVFEFKLTHISVSVRAAQGASGAKEARP